MYILLNIFICFLYILCEKMNFCKIVVFKSKIRKIKLKREKWNYVLGYV